jgi:hypothetical protein
MNSFKRLEEKEKQNELFKTKPNLTLLFYYFVVYNMEISICILKPDSWFGNFTNLHFLAISIISKDINEIISWLKQPCLNQVMWCFAKWIWDVYKFNISLSMNNLTSNFLSRSYEV